VFDCSKLKRLVPGFTATKRFDTGVREVIENVLANPALQPEDRDFDRWCDSVIEFMDKAAECIISANQVIPEGEIHDRR
jgi:hypothetical protein